MRRPAALVSLIVITAIGTALRLHDLSAESLWLDEASSVWIASHPPGLLIAETASDVHPPAYYLLLRWWMAVGGASEFWLRLLSVVAGTLSIPMIYAIGRAQSGRGAGLIGAALIAVSPFHIHYSQEVRMYALFGLVALVSTWALIVWADRRARVAAAVYVLATALMLYTHVYSFFVLAVHWIWIVSGGRAERARLTGGSASWWTMQAAVAVLVLPWLPSLVRQITKVRTEFWIEPWPLAQIPRAYAFLGGGGELAIAALAIAAAGVWARREARFDSATRLFASLALVPVLAPVLLSQIGPDIFLPKYALPASFGIALLAARGLANLPAAPGVLGGLLLAGLAVWSASRSSPFSGNHEWREAVAGVERTALPDDLVLYSQPWGRLPFEYYLGRTDLATATLLLRPGEEPGRTLARLQHASAGSRRIWWILSNAGPLPADLDRRLTEAFDVVIRRPLWGVEVLLLEPQWGTGRPPGRPPRPPEEP